MNWIDKPIFGYFNRNMGLTKGGTVHIEIGIVTIADHKQTQARP